jgi:toxin YhaV
VSRLAAAHERARKSDPKNFRLNANVKVLEALTDVMLKEIPSDPSRPQYRQGRTLGQAYRNWFRAKFSGRFRLFFRYDSRSHTIVYAWVNDDRTLRQQGGRRDPYEVFRRMLESGNPPNDWGALVRACEELPDDLLPPITSPSERA